MRWKPAVALLRRSLLAVAPAHAATSAPCATRSTGRRSEAASLGAEIRATQEQLARPKPKRRQPRRVSGSSATCSPTGANGRRAWRRRSSGPKRSWKRSAGACAAPAALWPSAWWRSTRVARRARPASILGSGDFDQLATRTEYLRQIEESDAQLAARVEQVRDQVRRELELVEELKARVVAYNERLAAARAEIDAVRDRAEAAAARVG